MDVNTVLDNNNSRARLEAVLPMVAEQTMRDILIANFDKAWSVNMVTGAETDGGNSISSDKYANPVK